MEPSITRNVGRSQMRVIIQNRLCGSELMKQTPRWLATQQEIIMDEFHQSSGSASGGENPNRTSILSSLCPGHQKFWRTKEKLRKFRIAMAISWRFTEVDGRFR